MDRMEQLKAFLVQHPDDLFSLHALAMEMIKRGQDDAAGDILVKLLAIDPGYIGSYYHLGKLLERQGKGERALDVYTRGMEEAKKAGDRHAFGELQSAIDLMD